MTIKQAVEAFQALPRMPRGEPTLKRMRRLLHRLGDPQEQLKCVHIAGTNGKGTTAAITANILTKAGYKTGLTISPYVVDFRERIQIDGQMIPARSFSALAPRVLAAAAEEGNNHFEAVTAMAVLWFAHMQCDIVVLETGLGGRYDATNAVGHTLAAAITRIGLDHTELLGDTLAQIAQEKAGILKEGCTVVCYPEQPKEALAELLAAAAQKHCRWMMPDADDITLYPGRPFTNRMDYGGYTVDLPFPGRHQALNAAVVVELCLALWRQGWHIPDEAILEGLATAMLPARQEVISRHPLVVLDGCHNPDGAAALADSLRPIVKEGGRVAMVLGVLADKAAAQMLECLEPVAGRVFTVAPDSPRALSAQALAEQAKYHFEAEACGSLRAAINKLLAEEAGAYVVCGSLYLASQARPLLRKRCK